jgi:hypothetical protein
MIEQKLNAEEEMMTTRSVNEASIVALRDKAMAMLKQGAWHDDGKGHRLLIRETEDLRLAYAGPLQMGAEEMPNEVLRGRDRQKRSPTARAKRMAKGDPAEGARPSKPGDRARRG